MKCSINYKIFNIIIDSPNYFSYSNLTFLYKSCDNSYLGFVLPRRLGPAYKRNLFKRRCREIFRTMNKRACFLNLGVIIKTNDVYVGYDNINNAFSGLSNNISLK